LTRVAVFGFGVPIFVCGSIRVLFILFRVLSSATFFLHGLLLASSCLLAFIFVFISFHLRVY
jgi:hypothetical protein